MTETQATPAEKRCTKCGRNRLLDEFHRHVRSPDGRDTRCAECCSKQKKTRYKNNPTHRRRIREKEREWRANNAGTRRGAVLRQLAAERKNQHRRTLRRYGLTVRDYKEMLAAQDYRCAICGSTNPYHKSKVFCVDHCHETGKIRGLLCHPCNNGLGRFQDDPKLLRAAAKYLTIPLVV